MATLVLHAHPNTPAWPAPATAIAPSSPRWRGAQGPEVHGTDFALAAVALSMLSTPLLMLAYERRVAPRYTIAGTREFDAIDDPETVRRTEEHCRTHYPDRGLIARARGRIDAYALTGLGVPIVRETFGSALETAELALRALGHGALQARSIVRRFRQHDEAQFAGQRAAQGDVETLKALAKSSRAQLERLLSDDAEDIAAARRSGKDSEW